MVKIMGGSVDEMLRNFGDTGQINGMNVSGSILIATSNETQKDLSNLEESLYNRYKGLNIHFKDFNSADYKELIRRKSVGIIKFYKTKYNIDISLDASALDYYGDKFEKEKAGGRGVDVSMNDIRAKLKFYQDKHPENFKDLQLSVSYDIDKPLYVK